MTPEQSAAVERECNEIIAKLDAVLPGGWALIVMLPCGVPAALGSNPKNNPVIMQAIADCRASLQRQEWRNAVNLN